MEWENFVEIKSMNSETASASESNVLFFFINKYYFLTVKYQYKKPYDDRIHIQVDDVDADDEQSDWPEFTDLQVNGNQSYHGKCFQDDKSILNPEIIRRIEHFALNSTEKELILAQVFRTSQVIFYLSGEFIIQNKFRLNKY